MENSTRLSQLSVSGSNGYFQRAMKDTFQLQHNRALISTSRSKDEKQNFSLSKSKIKALPHHNRLSIQNYKQFTVVFQAIQIERLSEEVQNQRKRQKELQKRIRNGENYEIQIKQLTDQCGCLQEQIKEYREELEKMNKICQKLYHENQNLKGKSKNKKATKVSFQDIGTEQDKINKLSSQILRLSEIINGKNEEIHALVEQNSIFRRKQAKIDQDLGFINQLRITCEQQHKQIQIKLKDLEKLHATNKQIQEQLQSQRLKSSQVALKLQQYRKNDRTLNSNYFTESYCTTYQPFGSPATSPDKVDKLMNKIRQLQLTIFQLKGKYNQLLVKVGGTL